MVNLRSKLHLARQGRKSSPRLLSDPPCLLNNEYDAAAATAAPTQQAGSSSAPEPSHLPSWSAPRRLTLDTLPEELVQKVAIFCGPDAFLGLRHTCRTLHRALDTPDFLAEIARRRVSLLDLLPPPHDLFLFPKEPSFPASCALGPCELSTLPEALGAKLLVDGWAGRHSSKNPCPLLPQHPSSQIGFYSMGRHVTSKHTDCTHRPG